MGLQKTIPELDQAGTLTGAEQLEMSQSGKSVKDTLTSIFALFVSTFTGSGSIVTTGIVTSGTWNAKTQKRVRTAASASSLTPNADTDDMVRLTLLAANISFVNPSGTPTEGQELDIRIKSDATPRTISFDTNYRFSASLPNPGTTTGSRTIYFRFKYNATATKWDCLTILDNF